MYKRVLDRAQLWPGEMRGCRVGDLDILLVNVDGCIVAYRDRCAHLGAALSEGRLEKGTIVCRAHEWCYDAATGKGVNPASAELQRFAVRLEEGAILVDIED